MPQEKFEAKPRWVGAPPICLHTNLMAFDDPSDFYKFESRNCPGNKTVMKWKCSKCNKFHFWGVGAGDPAGSSSGTGRSSKLIQSETYVTAIHRRFALKRKPAEA